MMFGRKPPPTPPTTYTLSPSTITTHTTTAFTSNRPPTLLFHFLPNNIHVALSDTNTGRLLFKLNAGTVGMKGTAKCSPKATMALVDAVYARVGVVAGEGGVRLHFRGVNAARALVVHQLKKAGMAITEVVDTTRVPFNGCRPRKSRRL